MGWFLEPHDQQIPWSLIEFEINLVLENGRICISEQLMLLVPDARESFLGLPFVLVRYGSVHPLVFVWTFQNTSESTPCTWVDPWAATGVHSMICVINPVLLPSLCVTNWLSCNAFCG